MDNTTLCVIACLSACGTLITFVIKSKCCKCWDCSIKTKKNNISNNIQGSSSSSDESYI